MIYYLKNRTGETFVESLKKSVAAGLMIGIGCIVYLSLESKIAGALLFSVGLFLICSFGMFLFTGKIGYIIKTGNKPNCAVIWLGNLFGSIAVSVIARIAKPSLHETAAAMVENKLNQNYLAIVILSFLCGILMYSAVENFRKNPNSVSGIVGIVLCVSVFILCGFEHSIADMNYLVMAISSADQALQYLLFIVVVSVSNGLGALAIRFLTKEKE